MRNSVVSGFTLVEIIIAIIIIMTVTTFGVASYSKFARRETLKQAALTLKADIRLLHSKAMTGVKPQQGTCTTLRGYNISFLSTSYSYAPVCSPVDENAETVTRYLPKGTEFSPVPSDILFRVLNEGINSAQNITINIINAAESYRMSIQPNGVITDYKYQ